MKAPVLERHRRAAVEGPLRCDVNDPRLSGELREWVNTGVIDEDSFHEFIGGAQAIADAEFNALARMTYPLYVLPDQERAAELLCHLLNVSEKDARDFIGDHTCGEEECEAIVLKGWRDRQLEQ